MVEKWLAFTCKLTTPGSRGDVTRRCYVVARHVRDWSKSIEGGGGGPEQRGGGSSVFEPLVRGGLCNF